MMQAVRGMEDASASRGLKHLAGFWHAGSKQFQLSAELLQEGRLIMAKFWEKMQNKYLLNVHKSLVRFRFPKWALAIQICF